jgi:hypothetical protein
MGVISKSGRDWTILRRDFIDIPTIPTLTTKTEAPKEEDEENSE